MDADTISIHLKRILKFKSDWPNGIGRCRFSTQITKKKGKENELNEEKKV